MTETDVANMALGHLGILKVVADLDTERSTEAIACRRFFDVARDATLADYAWPFATKIDDLTEVEEDPNDEWQFSYIYPTDCVGFRRIVGNRTDTRDTRIAFREAYSSTTRLIFTDEEDAVAEWTVRVEDTTLWPPSFSLALSLRLAVYIAPSLSAGDPWKMGARAMQLYIDELGMARSNASNAEQPDVEPDSEFVRARE